MSKLKEKQEQRKADKMGRKEKLKAALKTQVLFYFFKLYYFLAQAALIIIIIIISIQH